jgi:hypothetical protein
MSTPLSPAAQAIMVAATNGNINVVNDPVYKQCIAAALRAAADQVVPHLKEPDWGACNNGHCNIELYTDHQRKRAGFLAIAAELEGQS